MQDDNAISGDDYFSEGPESNGDVTSPNIGDVDSEAPEQPVDDLEAVEDEYPSDELEDAETPTEGDDADEEIDDEPTAEWLPGFEGRFRVGEEAKALNSYSELEKAYSKKDQEYRELIAAEREAAFEQAKKLLAQEKQEPTWQEREQQRGQLIGLAMQDPTTAFQYALDSGDEASINAVIHTVAMGDPELGIEGNAAAALEMQRLVTQSQTKAAIEEQRGQLAAMQAERFADQAGQRFTAKHADHLQVPELQQEFAAIAQQQKEAGYLDTSSPEAIENFLEDCLTRAYGKLAMSGAMPPPRPVEAVQPSDPHAEKRAARLEAGIPTRASRPVQKTDPADDYANDLLGIAKEVNPGYRL